MMIAFDVAASCTSDSVMPPTAEPTTVTFTSLDEIFSSASRSASALPCTSALISSWTLGMPPAAIWLKMFSSFAAC